VVGVRRNYNIPGYMENILDGCFRVASGNFFYFNCCCRGYCLGTRASFIGNTAMDCQTKKIKHRKEEEKNEEKNRKIFIGVRAILQYRVVGGELLFKLCNMHSLKTIDLTWHSCLWWVEFLISITNRKMDRYVVFWCIVAIGFCNSQCIMDYILVFMVFGLGRDS